MSDKELRRSEVLSRVRRGEWKLSEAAVRLEISYRQAKRLWSRYRKGGAKTLVHGNVGRRSNRAKPAEFRQRVMAVVREHYGGEPQQRFGPTLAAEQLREDHGLEVSVRTLRRWMLAAGLWSGRRRRRPHRTRRQRKAHFGELLQLDGSFHDWLEERGPRGITILAASSPQAKGRVERHHGTHQDRLIKKTRLRGIVDYEAANRYLDEEYLGQHNERFACEPAAGADFQQAPPRGTDLRGVFCLEYDRVVSNDRVVRFENRCLQLKPKRNQGVGAGAGVTVQQWRDQSLHVRFEEHKIEHEVIATPVPQPRTKPASPRRAGGGRKPAANHPWRRGLLRKTRSANS